MKKHLLVMALIISSVYTFGQKIENISSLFYSDNLVNKIVVDSMHTNMVIKLMMNGSVLQQETELEKIYYETDLIFGNEIKSLAYSTTDENINYVKKDSTLTSYDSYGRKTSHSWYKWDKDLNSWVFQSDEFYTYSGDTLITSSSEGIDDKEVIYYTNGLRDSTVRFEKDNGVWEKFSSSKYTYNADNNPAVIVDYSYDKTSQTFNPSTKSDYNYGIDENGKNYGYFTYLFWNGTTWTNTIDQSGYQIVQIIQGTFYYKIKEVKPTTEDELTKCASIRIYPNPATESVYINSDEETENTVSVYTLNGERVFYQQVKGNEYIPVSTLPNGIYLITVTNQKGILKEKLIKK